MKIRTSIIYEGKTYTSKSHNVSEKELEILKPSYTDNAGKLAALAFTGMNGTWYCFPPEVLARSILCIDVVNDD